MKRLAFTFILVCVLCLAISSTALAGAVPLDIDIKSGSDPNALNVQSKGVLPVAILGTDGFDIADIDVRTLSLWWPGFSDVGEVHPVHSAFEDINEDGLMDIILKFSMDDLNPVTLTKEAPGELVMTLVGETFEGIPIRGADTVRIINKKYNDF